MTSEQNLQLKEDYELWRKNCRYMYDFVSETALTWPSLTVQWLPPRNESLVHDTRLLFGTHTSGEDTNYLKLATTKLPSNSQSGASNAGKGTSIIKVSKKIEVSSEINRARYMPQDSNIVGTINGAGQCDIFDLNKGEMSARFSPHKKNGYGLSWNKFHDGLLLTASDDATCVLSDINKLDEKEGLVNMFENHTKIVNDVKWHVFDSNIFGSVSDDENVFIFDTRTPRAPVQRFHSRDSGGVNSLVFSPFSRHLFAIGNQNANIELFDMRNVSGSTHTHDVLHTMMGHGDAVTCMEFSPHVDGILASGSQDRRVIVWDLNKIGEEQAQEDSEDGAPELFMMHAGHTGAVTDLSWCPTQKWTLASTADDNILHLWKMSRNLIECDKAGEDLSRLE